MPEEIKVLIDFLDSEMNRFWTRFNIFSGVQILAIIGILTKAPVVMQSKVIAVAVLLVLIIFSIVGATVTYRGIDLQRAAVTSLREMESRFPDGNQVVTKVLNNSRMTPGMAPWACFGLNLCFILFWILIAIWLFVPGGYDQLIAGRPNALVSE